MKHLLLIFTGLLLTVCAVAQTSWSLTGNEGTADTDFLGTTDNRPLIFKVNHQRAGFSGDAANYNVSWGYLSFNPFTGGANTAVGAQALGANSTGYGNVAIGTYALDANSTGEFNVAVGESASAKQHGAVSHTVAIGRTALMHNAKSGNTAVGFEAGLVNTEGEALTAVGFKALRHNSTGIQNTAIGFNALINNTEGTNNTALGAWTLIGNSTGCHNTAAGMKALYSNTTGEYNTAIGVQAMQMNTSGNWNAGLASGALYSNTTGYWNTAVGTSALWYNTTGSENTAVGGEALAGNLDGSMNTAVGTRALWSTDNLGGPLHYGRGSGNTAMGYEALREITEGANNVGIGKHTLRVNSSGNANVGVGTYALTNNTCGFDNVAVGTRALVANTAGNQNTAIGNYAEVNSGNLTNATAIGYGSLATASNQVMIGNSHVTSIGGYVPWSTISDGRVKCNIRPDVLGLAFINRLEPVTYNLDYDEADRITNNGHLSRTGTRSADVDMLTTTGDSHQQANDPATVETRNIARPNRLLTGFVAQNVESAALSIGYDFSGLDAPENEKNLYGLRYSEFIAPLVKAVQELTGINNALERRIELLEEMVDRLQSGNGNNPPVSNARIPYHDASLEQNFPNPYNYTSTIRYTLPQAFGSAKIIITSTSGVTMKHLPLAAGSGAGQITVDAGSLPAGMYFYSLVIDGTKVDTKKMIVSK
ncbi:MAG: tail fiber domain-containing protein [Tannerella sp.]|jgi:hypothetical protein|nr:tail fiber domain-containing protein [Tannerella sp.]